jgi:hypothetical protein
VKIELTYKGFADAVLVVLSAAESARALIAKPLCPPFVHPLQGDKYTDRTRTRLNDLL